MSTRVDIAHVEIPAGLHAILRKISDKTGIKIKNLAKDLIIEGLKTDCSAGMVARSGAEKEIEEIAK
ncbi:MAG: hypothetical protein WAX69_00175 [Victivallales bacterium]